MQVKIGIGQILIIALLGYLIFLTQCNSSGDGSTTTNTIVKTEYIHDTLVHRIETRMPYPVYYDRHYYHDSVITQIVEIDTQELIKDYFTEYYYSDTISNDSIDVYLEEKVFKNSIVSRDLAYRLKFPVVVNNTYHIKDENNVYLGVHSGFSRTSISLAPTIGFERKWGLITGGYDILNNQYQLGVYKKFSLRKPKIP